MLCFSNIVTKRVKCVKTFCLKSSFCNVLFILNIHQSTDINEIKVKCDDETTMMSEKRVPQLLMIAPNLQIFSIQIVNRFIWANNKSL